MEKNHQTELVKTGERVDDLQNGFYVIQNQNKFCFGCGTTVRICQN